MRVARIGLKRGSKAGFTIVELLIVVVVIAILAAIVVVAYTGVQQRAKNVVITSSVSDAIKLLSLYQQENGRWPQEANTNRFYSYCLGRNFPTMSSYLAPTASPTAIPTQGCVDSNGTVVNEATWLADVVKPYGNLPTAQSMLKASNFAVGPVYTTVSTGYVPGLCGVAGWTYPPNAPTWNGQSCSRFYIEYGLTGDVPNCGGLQFAQSAGMYAGWTRCFIMLEFYG